MPNPEKIVKVIRQNLPIFGNLLPIMKTPLKIKLALKPPSIARRVERRSGGPPFNDSEEC